MRLHACETGPRESAQYVAPEAVRLVIGPWNAIPSRIRPSLSRWLQTYWMNGKPPKAPMLLEAWKLSPPQIL